MYGFKTPLGVEEAGKRPEIGKETQMLIHWRLTLSFRAESSITGRKDEYLEQINTFDSSRC
jgi:hypothetical protein